MHGKLKIEMFIGKLLKIDCLNGELILIVILKKEFLENLIDYHYSGIL